MLRRSVAGAVVGLVVLGGVARGDEPPAPTGVVGSGEVVQKRYHWQAGMTTYYRMVTTSDMTVGEGAEARPSHDVVAILSRQEVYSVKDDGTGRVATTFVRVRKENDAGSKGKTVFDSAEPGKSNDEVTKKSMGAMVGRTIIMELTPEGHLVRQEGVSEMIDAMFGAMDGEAGGAELKETMGKFKDSMKKGMGQMISGCVANGSEGLGVGHRVGEEWTSEREGAVPIFGDTKGTVTNKIVSVERVDGRRFVTTTCKGEQDMKSGAGDGGPLGAMPIPMTMTMHAERSGIEVFDLDRGRSVRSESIVKASGSMTITMPDLDGKVGADKGETKKISGTTRTVTELVGAEDPILPGVK